MKTEIKTRKTIPLVGGAEAHVDLYTGKHVLTIPDVKDEVMGITVSHQINSCTVDKGYGDAVKLNIDEQLIKQEADETTGVVNYTYVDSLGDEYTLEERFYYVDNDGTKKYVEKSDVMTDKYGCMYMPISGEGFRTVYREQVSENGYKAITKIENMACANYVEQKDDEIKQLDEQVFSYGEAISDHVIMNAFGIVYNTTENNESMINEFAKAIEVEDPNNKCVTIAEALNAEALIAQKQSLEINKNSIDHSIASIETSKASLENTRNSLLLQKKLLEDQSLSTDEQILILKKQSKKNISYFEYEEAQMENATLPDEYEDYIDTIADNYVICNGSGEIIRNIDVLTDIFEEDIDTGEYLLLNSEAHSLRIASRSKNASVTVDETEVVTQISNINDQLSNIEQQLADIEVQKADLQAQATNLYYHQMPSCQNQIDEILAKAPSTREKLLRYCREYFSLQKKLKEKKLNTPVSFLMAGGAVKGFNEKGALVSIHNGNNKYISIEYEYDGMFASTRISRVYNELGREIKFYYNELERLAEIVDSTGKRASISYLYQNIGPGIYEIDKITYSDGKSFSFVRNGTSYDLNYENSTSSVILNVEGKITSVTNKSNFTAVEHGSVTLADTPKTISYNNFTYDTELNKTTVTNDIDDEFIYLFHSEEQKLNEYVEKKEGKVVKAERYSYEPFGNMDVITADKRSLYGTEVSFDHAYTIDTILDSFNRKQREETIGKEVLCVSEDIIKQDSVTEYTYDRDSKVVKAVNTVKLYKTTEPNIILDTKTTVSLTDYDTKGNVLKKQSYVVGEEKTNGINIEEHVYDKNGYEIRVIKYNSLDPSSKFYTEKELNEHGVVVAQLDETGKYKTAFEHENGTTDVSSEIYPNGSKLSYGTSVIDNSTAITISTEDGVGNSIQVLRTNGLVTKVKSEDSEYGYKYDGEGRTTRIDMNGLVVATMEYEEMDAWDKVTVDEKGATETTYTDKQGKLLEKIIEVGDSTRGLENEYDTRDNLIYTSNYSNGVQMLTQYFYDSLDRITGCTRSDGTNTTSEAYTYDNYGKLTSKVASNVNGTTTYNYTYSQDSKKKLEQVKLVEDNIVIKPKRDILDRSTGRIVTISNSQIINDTIEYVKHGSHATNMPLSIKYIDRNKLSYKYDSMGNIARVYENGVLSVEYKYDLLNRLVRENNKSLNKTTVFNYDVRGNIVSKTEYPFTLKTGDELEELEGNTMECKFNVLDFISSFGDYTFNYNIVTGIPYEYKGNDVTFNGKEMVAYGTNTFTYDAKGRRTSKNEITYTYDVKDRLIKQSNGISFIYDHESLIGFKYNNTKLFYRKDILGNIIAILDSSGNVVVKYTYDAWGNHTVENVAGLPFADTIGNLNPYRYRGYYYDTETGLYYLNARYYDPEICRFISSDDVAYIDQETIGGVNLYAYCNSNPVMNSDPSGNFAIASFLIGMAVSAFVGWAASEIFGEQIASGASSVAGGATAVSTGASLLAFGPVGWVAGGALMLAGLGTMAFGANEIATGITGTNYIQKWTGMSDGLYNGLYTGLNIASAVGSIAGVAYMNYANVSGTKYPDRSGKPLSRYSLLDENGTKQYRFFNSKGSVWYDKDFRHGGAKLKFPHYHGWKNGTKLDGHWSFLDLIKWLL